MSFYREAAVLATRKEHRCSVCMGPIYTGNAAVRWVGMVDGDFQSVVYHPDCREAEVAFNDMHGLGGCDWVSLAYDRDLEDDQWLLSSFPAVAKRINIVALP